MEFLGELWSVWWKMSVAKIVQRTVDKWTAGGGMGKHNRHNNDAFLSTKHYDKDSCLGVEGRILKLIK
jgi:hypothetical protein